MTNNQKIDGLKNGQSVVLSQVGEAVVTAEKSGNGKVVRIVRTISGKSVVIETIR